MFCSGLIKHSTLCSKQTIVIRDEMNRIMRNIEIKEWKNIFLLAIEAMIILWRVQYDYLVYANESMPLWIWIVSRRRLFNGGCDMNESDCRRLLVSLRYNPAGGWWKSNYNSGRVSLWARNCFRSFGKIKSCMTLVWLLSPNFLFGLAKNNFVLVLVRTTC